MITFCISGTDIMFSVPFFGLLALLSFVDCTGLLLPTYFAVFLHEAGHITTMLLNHSKPQKIIFKPCAVEVVSNFTADDKQQFLMLAAGPFVNLAAATLLFCLGYFFNFQNCFVFSVINLAIGLFHLMPITGLDGGDMLFILFCRKKGSSAAKRAVAFTSIFMGSLSVICALIIFIKQPQNYKLLLSVLYIFLVIFINHRCKK